MIKFAPNKVLFCATANKVEYYLFERTFVPLKINSVYGIYLK